MIDSTKQYIQKVPKIKARRGGASL